MNRKYITTISWLIIFGVVGRLFSPLPNVTPFIGMSLFVRTIFPKFYSLLVIFVALLISDVGLSFMKGYPIIGYFTLFTYTGFMAIVLFKSRISSSKQNFFYSLNSSLGYWLWTNFGVWLTGDWYHNSFTGLMTCYYLALPFLRNSLIGDIFWCFIIFGTSVIFNKLARVAKSGRRAGFRFQ